MGVNALQVNEVFSEFKGGSEAVTLKSLAGSDPA